MTAQIVLGIVFLSAACSPATPSSEGDGRPTEQGEAPDGQQLPRPARPRDAGGPLCADCIALGGETGDFTGGGQPPSDPCPPYTLADADSELVTASGLSAAAAIAFVERERHIPAAWTPTGNPNNPLDMEREVSGFSPQTSLTLALEVTGVQRLEWSASDEAESSPGARAACDGIALSANVSIATDDGSLTGTFEGVTVHVYSESEAQLRATGDISSFTGSLELDPGPGEGLGGWLQAYFDADQARGLLVPYVQLPPDGDPYSYRMYQPLHLRWPGNDACNEYSFPYPGGEGATRVEPVIAVLASSSPYTASYLAPERFYDEPTVLGTTELALDVAEPSNVCHGREVGYHARSPGQYFEFELAARLHGDDGRYDLSLPLSVMARGLPDGTIRLADARFYSRAMPVAEFQTRFGVDGLELGEAGCAELSFEYVPLLERPLARLLMVEAGPCGPLDSNGDLLEGRPVEVLAR